MLKNIAYNSNPNDTPLSVFQRFLLQTIAKRDISAQETCHILLGIPLYHSSRQFVILNLNKESFQWLCGTGTETNGNFLHNDENGRTVQSPLQKYWKRSAEFENLTLFQLYQKYHFWQGQWKQCKRENIVRIWPRPSPQRNGPQWEDFCRIKVLLHVCHRNLDQLTEENSKSWSELFNQHLNEIENDPIDLLGSPVDNIENNEILDEE